MVCKSCNGVGMLASKFGDKTDNPFPCQDCLENGICPKCDKEMILSEKTQSYNCPHCGWDEEAVSKEGF